MLAQLRLYIDKLLYDHAVDPAEMVAATLRRAMLEFDAPFDSLLIEIVVSNPPSAKPISDTV